MTFYTNVARYGNSLLYRGYTDNGTPVSHKYKFKPTMFVNTQNDSEWKTLTGKAVAPVQFDSMGEAKDFIKQYDEISNTEIFGTSNFIHQFVTEKFPNDIKFNRSMINVFNIDIEVHSEDGFPLPEEARHPVCYYS